QPFPAGGGGAWPSPTTAPVVDGMFRDGAGGIYLFGSPLTGSQLELHRRAADASTPAGWAGGRVLTPASPRSSAAAVLSGSRIYAAWSVGSPGQDDVFATALLADGSLAPGWAAGGNTVSRASGQQLLYAMLPGSANDALLAWSDRRSGTSSDVYVGRLTPGGPAVTGVPDGAPEVALAAERVSPNPARANAALSLMLPESAPATVEV